MYHSPIQKQKGVSLSRLLVWSEILIFTSILGMKLIPVYMEHATIKKALVAISKDVTLQSAPLSEIRLLFDKRAQIDNIKTIRGKDIEINLEKEQKVLSVKYSVKTPLFANIALIIDFEASSNQ
ncbi:MAG: DUF4845 domain-containing protein [Pseudomonadota bacterium]